MEDRGERTYGARCADVYDEWFGHFEEAALDVLAGLAGGGRALELGIGTGAVALPLAARGVEVHGIDSRMRSRQVVFTEGGVRVFPVEVRYAWLSELDLMAQLAGLRLRERWGGWRREEFTAGSEKHVSVYERPA